MFEWLSARIAGVIRNDAQTNRSQHRHTRVIVGRNLLVLIQQGDESTDEANYVPYIYKAPSRRLVRKIRVNNTETQT